MIDKFQIKRITPAELESHGVIKSAKKTGYVCPECGNGTGSNGDGIIEYPNPDGYSYHCFKCGKTFDNISLLALHYHLHQRTDFREILNRAGAEFFGGMQAYHENLIPYKVEKFQAQVSEQTISLIRNDIKEAQKHLKEMPKDYRRGLTLNVLKYFGCGFTKNWLHPNWRLPNYTGKVPNPTERLIIPSGDSYTAVLPQKFRTVKNKGYWKMHAGAIQTFGLSTIDANTSFIFVFEGEIDAMSAFQTNFLKTTMAIFETNKYQPLEEGGKYEDMALAYIATGGAASSKWLESVISKCRQLKICPEFIVIFDDDDAGRLNANKQVKEILKRGFNVTEYFFEEDESNEKGQ